MKHITTHLLTCSLFLSHNVYREAHEKTQLAAENQKLAAEAQMAQIQAGHEAQMAQIHAEAQMAQQAAADAQNAAAAQMHNVQMAQQIASVEAAQLYSTQQLQAGVPPGVFLLLPLLCFLLW